MIIRSICKRDHVALEKIIKSNLEYFDLALPGTVYFDPILAHLSDDYLGFNHRFYFVLEIDGEVKGGIGLSEMNGFDHCCELQKLYLSFDVKGNGYGKVLISTLESKAKELGYSNIYLETHHNLVPAIHLYKRCGYQLIDRPNFVNHDTMDLFFMKRLD